jgi:hypothetical protein
MEAAVSKVGEQFLDCRVSYREGVYDEGPPPRYHQVLRRRSGVVVELVARNTVEIRSEEWPPMRKRLGVPWLELVSGNGEDLVARWLDKTPPKGKRVARR